jgi:tRNA nucleotidyltransferase (CCA-adding enzyme)
MKPGKIMKLLEQLDAIRSKSVHEFVQACEADYRGRKGLQDRQYPQGPFLAMVLETALKVRLADLPPDQAASGPELGEKLRAARIEAIADLAVNHPEYTGGRSP